MASVSEEERLKRLYKLRQMELRKEAPANFASFLKYSVPKYQLKWFHRVIADHCQMLYEGKIKNLMVFMPPQHGKLLPANTPIWTTKGWKKHGDLEYGDYVFGQDGKPKMVLGNSGVYDWNVEELIFQNGQTIYAAKEHLWKLEVDYDDHKGRRTVINETQEIFKRHHRRSPYIDCAPALEMPECQLPIDPYILGVWLGDGLSSYGCIISGEEDSNYFSQFGESRKTKDRYYRIRIPNLTSELNKLNLLHNKHIPLQYLLSSKGQRESLLQGLMDTDGTVDKRGNCEFTQKSGRLAEEVYTLIRTLGYKARKNYYRAILNGTDVGEKTRILFNPDINDEIFRLPRKALRLKNKTTKDRNDKKKFFLSSVTPYGIVKGNCIQVEGGMYLAGEHLIPTHNSTVISEAFPAWILGRNPRLKIVGSSYASSLAEKACRNIQLIIDSDKYPGLFPNTSLNGMNNRRLPNYKRNDDYFDIVDYNGFYKAVGVGQGLTGTPADIAIIDDPIKDAMEAYSQKVRESVWAWYASVLMTRLHNDSKQLFIMTRWHEDDLAGRILRLEPEKWTVLKIPAIRETIDDGNEFDPRQIGEPLWPERHSLERLLAAKKRSAKVFSALYQQSPTIDGGNIIREAWFRYISAEDFRRMRERKELDCPIHFFIDTAFTEKTSNDPTGIIGVCFIDGNLYISCAEKVNLKFPDLVRHIPEYVRMNGYNRFSSVRIEPKANGLSVIDQLQELTDLNVVATPTPRESKETRLNAASPFVESGRVYLVKGMWNEEFISEVCGFPAMPHDEFVDLLGYAIDHCHNDAEDLSDEEIMRLGFL